MTLSRKSSLYSLLFTIFNDAIGWGIVLTIFAPLIFDPHHSILPLDTSDSARNIILGFLIGSYAVTQFISMPLIGALSDHLGRKKVLEWTIFGAMAAFVLSAFAIWFGSLVLLFICRLLAGLFSGNSATAQASIADISTEKAKSKNLSLSGIVGGISWIIGPPLGGFLSTTKWVSWFDFATPFWFLAVLFFINLLWVHKSFEETLIQTREKHDWKQEIKDLRKLSKIPRMSGWLIVSLLFYFGWFFYVLYYPTLLVQEFGFNQEEIGYYSGYLAIFWFLASLVLNRGLAERFKAEAFIFWALPITGLLVLITAFMPNIRWWLLTTPFMSVGAAALWINVMAIISNLAGKENQGKAFGILQSLQSAGLFISPLCAGFLASVNIFIPFWISAAILIVAGLFAGYLYKTERQIH